ncbi:MAG: NYN domain-containing protein [Nautiliaceae bacterium]
MSFKLSNYFNRAILFIDNSNLLNVLKDITGNMDCNGVRVHYGKLVDFFEEYLSSESIKIKEVILYDGEVISDVCKRDKKERFLNSVKLILSKKGISFIAKIYPIDLTREKNVKQVDSAIVVDILSKAVRREMDVVILISGDRDFVPLLKEVKENFRLPVIVGFFDKGLSKELKEESFFINLELDKISF